MMRPIFFFLFLHLVGSISAQAVRVKDINPGQNSSDPFSLTLTNNGILYFFATDGITGYELWKSDGTEGGTVLVKDINAGEESSIFSFLNPAVMFGNLFCFYADDGINGAELWKSNGSENGTEMVADLRPGAEGAALGEEIILFNNALYFPAFDGSGPGQGFKFYRSNATASGTQVIKDAYTVRGISVIKNGLMYYNAYGDFSEGYEPWKSDGTPDGTELLKDICPNTGHGDPDNFTLFNNQVFFTAKETNDGGKELWKSDGTSAGTMQVKDIYPGVGIQNTGPSNLTTLGGFLYFFADDGVHGNELWKSDGTAAGTEMVTDINPGANASVCCFLQAYDGNLYFGADDGTHGNELFKSDGTAGGTALLKDIFSGTMGSDPEFSIVFDGRLFFSADDGVHGRELWSTDGSPANTGLIQDISEGSGWSSPSGFTANDDYLYFTAYDDSGNELWKYASAALPVTLTEFNAKQTGKTVQLLWRTEIEKNNKGFEVQRSADLKEWSVIGFVTARNEAALYQFEDVSPYPELNYYRLKQVDQDQKFEFSKVISVKLNTNTFKCFQAGKMLYINGIESKDPLVVQISDLTGRTLLQKNVPANTAGEYTFSLQDLAPGVYMAVVYSGPQKRTLKILID